MSALDPLHVRVCGEISSMLVSITNSRSSALAVAWSSQRTRSTLGNFSYFASRRRNPFLPVSFWEPGQRSRKQSPGSLHPWRQYSPECHWNKKARLSTTLRPRAAAQESGRGPSQQCHCRREAANKRTLRPIIQRDGCAHHINDRVECAHFMKVDFFDWFVVNARFAQPGAKNPAARSFTESDNDEP